jgi:hypothetical protein
MAAPNSIIFLNDLRSLQSLPAFRRRYQFVRPTHTTFLPKRSYQNVPSKTFLKIKFLKKRILAIKFLTQNVPEKTILPITLLDKFDSHKKYSQEQIVPMYKWFPCTNGSHVQMVPRYKWFLCTNGSQVHMARLPGTNGSHVQMVPMYKWFPCTNDSCVKMFPKCNMFAPSSPQCGMQYVCTKFPTMLNITILQCFTS